MSALAAVLTAPHLSRWSLTGLDGRHLWVDAPPWWTPTPSVGDSAAYTAVPEDGSWALTSPIVRDGGIVVHEVPWRPSLLASVLVGARTPARDTGGDVTPAAHALSRFLGWLHTVPPGEPPTGRVAGPTWVDRLADPPQASLAARPHWQRLGSRLRDAGDRDRTTVHGELRTDHVLVPSQTGDLPAVVVLRVPGQLIVADPALDLGSLLGDLLELALLGSMPAVRAAQVVRRGYARERPRDDAFWSRVAGYAALKVVEHELRLRSSRDVETSATTLDRLDDLARRVATGVAGLADAGQGSGS